MNKFELSVIFGMFCGWVQLMSGFTEHAFYSLGIMITVVLLGILGYLRIIYLDKK